MFTFFGGGAAVQWYADIEWSGSQDVTSMQNLDFRSIPGWSVNHNFSAPVASDGSQVAASAGLYLCEVFASYEVAITSPFLVQLLGDSGSLSKTAISLPGTAPGNDVISGLFTQFIRFPVLLSLGITNQTVNTITITDLEIRISKLL